MEKFFLLVLPFVIFSSAWGEVSIQNDQQYLGNDGTLHIVGEIENDFSVPINQIEVEAELFSNGILIDTVKSSAMLSTIMPDMKGPFDILVIGDVTKNIEKYSLKISYKITEPKNQVIDITSSDFMLDKTDNIVIKGTVENRGDITANTIIVVATLYDKDGDVAAVARNHVEPDYLGSDDQSFFFITIPDMPKSDSIIDYTIVAESEEYAAVPEFPLGTIIFLTVSVSAYVVIIRYSEMFTTSLISAADSR